MEYFLLKIEINSFINERKNKEYSQFPPQVTNIEERERGDLGSSSGLGNRCPDVQSPVFKCHFSGSHFYL